MNNLILLLAGAFVAVFCATYYMLFFYHPVAMGVFTFFFWIWAAYCMTTAPVMDEGDGDFFEEEA